MKRLPDSIDLTDLQFLEYGDLITIANKHKERHPGKKTHPNYVCNVIAGRNRNYEILIIAWEEAQKKKSKFPKQMIKP